MEPKFCKGDRVRLLHSPNARQNLYAGDVGTVISSGNIPRTNGHTWFYVVDWGKPVDTNGMFGRHTLWAVSEGIIELALETEMSELDPAFTDLL